MIIHNLAPAFSALKLGAPTWSTTTATMLREHLPRLGGNAKLLALEAHELKSIWEN